MPLSNYQTMDPFMLLSICNMKMRDEELDLEGLCRNYDLDQEILTKRLRAAGFEYDAKTRQFR